MWGVRRTFRRAGFGLVLRSCAILRRARVGGWPAGAVSRTVGWRVQATRQLRDAADFQHFLHGDGRERQEIRTAVRIRWLANDVAKTSASSTADRSAARQSDRANRMPPQGRGRQDHAPIPRRLHPSVPGRGRERPAIAGGRAAIGDLPKFAYDACSRQASGVDR